MDLYPFCKDTFIWPSVYGYVLTNQKDIRSEKTGVYTGPKCFMKDIKNSKKQLYNNIYLLVSVIYDYFISSTKSLVIPYFLIEILLMA